MVRARAGIVVAVVVVRGGVSGAVTAVRNFLGARRVGALSVQAGEELWAALALVSPRPRLAAGVGGGGAQMSLWQLLSGFNPSWGPTSPRERRVFDRGP